MLPESTTEAFLNWMDTHSGTGSALATVAMGAAIVGLYFVTWRESDHKREGNNLARRNFVATYPPELQVRDFEIVTTDYGAPLVVEFEVVNIGKTTATVTGGFTTLYFAYSPKMPYVTIREGDAIKTGGKLAGGTLYRGSATREGTTLGSIDFCKITGQEFLVIGGITYVDDNGRPRATGFARVYSPETGKFTSIDDPNYEYAGSS